MTSAENNFAIDANVILRYLLRDDEKQFQQAKLIFAALEAGKIQVQLDPVNLAEAVWVLKSFYQVKPKDICEILLPVMQCRNIIIPDKPRYLLAMRLFGGGVKHFGDACACASALEDCGGQLFSFDRELSRVAGIKRKETV